MEDRETYYKWQLFIFDIRKEDLKFKEVKSSSFWEYAVLKLVKDYILKKLAK